MTGPGDPPPSLPEPNAEPAAEPAPLLEARALRLAGLRSLLALPLLVGGALLARGPSLPAAAAGASLTIAVVAVTLVERRAVARGAGYWEVALRVGLAAFAGVALAGVQAVYVFGLWRGGVGQGLESMAGVVASADAWRVVLGALLLAGVFAFASALHSQQATSCRDALGLLLAHALAVWALLLLKDRSAATPSMVVFVMVFDFLSAGFVIAGYTAADRLEERTPWPQG